MSDKVDDRSFPEKLAQQEKKGADRAKGKTGGGGGSGAITPADWKIVTPAQIQALAPSQAGKSERLLDMVKYDKDIFDNEFETVFYVAPRAHERPDYTDKLAKICQDRGKKLVMSDAIPNVNQVIDEAGGKHSLLILDDLLLFKDLSGVVEFSSMHCHHHNITAIYALQNCYEKVRGFQLTTLNRNLTGRLIFYQHNDLRMFQILNSTLYPERKQFIYSCLKAAKEEGRNYIFVNTHCFSTLPRRYCCYTNLFPYEQGEEKSPKFFDLNGDI